MGKLYKLFIIVFFSFALSSQSQNITYSKSFLDLTGEPATSIVTNVKFSNSGTDTIEVFVNRFSKNLPVNWTSCFCFMQCHLPSLDTLRFDLAPGEYATIGVSFNTDTLEGIGFVSLTIEEVGGNQKDTIHFSGSTLATGIKEINTYGSFSSYPNPTKDKITFVTAMNEEFSLSIIDPSGKLIEHHSMIKEKKFVFDLGSYPAGLYIININYRSGKIQTKKIIKN